MDEFEDKLETTKEVEEEQQVVEDSEKLEEVYIGRQELYIKSYGTVIFDMPSPGLSIKGDQVAAKFKAYNLRHNELLTDAQLRAIYNQPITIMVDGKEVKVGNGEWPEKNDAELEELPKKISASLEMFDAYRADYHAAKEQVTALTASGKTKSSKVFKDAEAKMEKAKEQARKEYDNILALRSRQMSLTSLRVRLFADSLEEQAFLEKVKLFAPSCIKKKDKDGNIVPCWKTIEEFENDTFGAIQIIAYFNLFLRGLDVSFFGDVPEEAIPS